MRPKNRSVKCPTKLFSGKAGDAEPNLYRHTIQAEKLLALLRSAHGAWVALPDILALGIAQYNARIFELRKRFTIENRTEIVDGVRHSWFRLVQAKSDAPEPGAGESDYMRRIREDQARAMPLFNLGVRP
ncbi:MAG TPA: hypothetical protein VGT24_09390 [Candidatus Acidoferrales bacterium]|nr:hypothetical protein [Candidatus Acidoferrales bacterium]